MNLIFFIFYLSLHKVYGTKNRTKLFFIIFQFSVFILIPLFVLSELDKKEIINWPWKSIPFNLKNIIFFFIICLISIYDHFNFFKEEKTNTILEKYFDKYKFIERHPLLYFFGIFAFLPLVLLVMLFIIFRILP